MAINPDHPNFYLFLQKALEVPAHLCRKLTWFFNGQPDLSQSKLLEESSLHSGISLAKQLEGFFALDQWYTEQLRRQLEHPDKVAYEQIIKKLENNLWAVTSFLQRIAYHFSRLPK